MQAWLKRLSIISLLGFPIAAMGTRFGVFNFKIGILLVAVVLLLALLVFLFSAFCLLKRKYSDTKSIKIALFLSAIPLFGIGSVIVGAGNLPKIHNISTDVVDPPKFNKIKDIRTTEDNTLEYNVSELAGVQQGAYPDVKTIYTDLSRQQAQSRAVTVVATLGWELVDNNVETGLIEASHTSSLWGFTDDIVIRLKRNSTNNKTVIDLRSVSRVGQSDLGANAKRIRAFTKEFIQN